MIEISHLYKTYRIKGRAVEAVRDVSLDIPDGEIYGVIGYSGAGKSTLVRCINLLEVPDAGRVTINGRTLFNSERGSPRISNRELNEARRGIGMIFQHFNLFDRSTVFENVAYPLKYSGLKRPEIENRVFDLLDLVGISDKANAYPSQLSGGQKQRVAIARALANDPKVLLSDEATSALDPDATEAILGLLKNLNEKLGLTIILITHEMNVIKSICQHVAVMEEGTIVEQGEVYELFSNPRQPITEKFITSASPLGKVQKLVESGSPLVKVQGNALLVKLVFERDCVGDAVISNVSRMFDINVNIVLANVDIIQDSPLGGMVAVLQGTSENILKAMRYLSDIKVKTEVIEHGSSN